jgi:PleD family two-component response regulator
MKTLLEKKSSAEPVNILLVGNNPIEMGPVLEKLHQVRKRKIITEIAFDIESIVERLVKFRPNFIFIDDNIGSKELLETVGKLSSHKRTRGIPITVLKNNNYREVLASTSIQDYLLKQNLSTEALYNTIKNTLRLRQAQRYLYQAYKNRKGMLKRMLEKKMLNLIG